MGLFAVGRFDAPIMTPRPSRILPINRTQVQRGKLRSLQPERPHHLLRDEHYLQGPTAKFTSVDGAFRECVTWLNRLRCTETALALF